jgi:hypothetical protein
MVRVLRQLKLAALLHCGDTKVMSFARPSAACGVNGLAHAKDACESEGVMSDPSDPIIAKLRAWGVPVTRDALLLIVICRPQARGR